MKRNGKYRFSLQFGSDTEEQIRAGELLERLGNKKSMMVVSALTEYIEHHQEADIKKKVEQFDVIPVIRRDELEEIIRRIINESMVYADEPKTVASGEPLQSEITDTDIEAMLGNLELFQ